MTNLPSFKILSGKMPSEDVRVLTGWHSFDNAFLSKDGAVGLVLSPLELYGPTHSGKSTFAYSLAANIAKKLGSNIVLADIEGFNTETLSNCLTNQGFDGGLHLVTAEKDEEVLDEFCVKMGEKNNKVSIFDSIGAISPIAEVSGQHGEANMGRKAKLMSQHFRKVIHLTRNSPRLGIYINHQLPILGTIPGMTTGGGQAIKYLSNLRINVKHGKRIPEKKPETLAYFLEGTVDKNRHGYDGRKFQVFIISGWGVHSGMTAMFDSVAYGLATDDRGIIKINGETVGRKRNLLDLAMNGKDEVFAPFFELLEKNNTVSISADDEMEGDSEE